MRHFCASHPIAAPPLEIRRHMDAILSGLPRRFSVLRSEDPESYRNSALCATHTLLTLLPLKTQIGLDLVPILLSEITPKINFGKDSHGRSVYWHIIDPIAS